MKNEKNIVALNVWKRFVDELPQGVVNDAYQRMVIATAIKARDGAPPLLGGCARCGEIHADDMYTYQGLTVCGDCRYFLRTGRSAPYGGSSLRDADPTHDEVYDGEELKPLRKAQKLTVRSRKDVDIVAELLRDSTLSLE